MDAYQIIGAVIIIRVLIFLLKKIVDAWQRMGVIVAAIVIFGVQPARAQDPEPEPEPETPVVTYSAWQAAQWQVFGLAFIAGGMLWGRIEKHLRI